MNGSSPRRDHDQVPGSDPPLRQQTPVSRPHDPFASVPHHGISELGRRREADPVEILLPRIFLFQPGRLVVPQHIYADGRRDLSRSLGIRLDEQMIFLDRKFLHKQPPLPAGSFASDSVGESCSALGASSLQDLSTIGCAHSLHKAVFLRSLKLFRLVCSYHVQSPLFFGIFMTLPYIIHTSISVCQVFFSSLPPIPQKTERRGGMRRGNDGFNAEYYRKSGGQSKSAPSVGGLPTPCVGAFCLRDAGIHRRRPPAPPPPWRGDCPTGHRSVLVGHDLTGRRSVGYVLSSDPIPLMI